jgi:GR25 family glycosyltransferase involved in LPS biosynthesis
MGELCRIGAPLHRIYHYKAKKESITGQKLLDSYLGATKNHLDVTKHFLDNGYENCLIVEDDVVFTSNINQHKQDLATFFSRKYAFDICFITCSKYHNYQVHDDLLSLSKQECTTSSGYILNRDTAQRVLDCFVEGYDKMLATGDYNTYVCDRYWTKLMPDNRVFFFNNRFGYQRPSWSSIESQHRCNFD